MSSIVDFIFGGSDDAKAAQPQGPSKTEVEAQEREKELLDIQEAKSVRESTARNKVITARAAGPQTLFARTGATAIPKKLSGSAN